MLVLNILYVLLAIAMIALILMQRGAGAQAGAGFGGGGASGTVFGARGASNFLTKTTKWLAVAFFGLSLFMAWQTMRDHRPAAAENGGLMSELPVAPPAAAGGAIPAAPAAGAAVPAAPTPAASVPVAPSSQPAAPAVAAPAPAAPSTPPAGG